MNHSSTVSFPCPNCRRTLRAKEQSAGTLGSCPGCGEQISVPVPAKNGEGACLKAPPPLHRINTPSPPQLRRRDNLFDSLGRRMGDGWHRIRPKLNWLLAHPNQFAFAAMASLIGGTAMTEIFRLHFFRDREMVFAVAFASLVLGLGLAAIIGYLARWPLWTCSALCLPLWGCTLGHPSGWVVFANYTCFLGMVGAFCMGVQITWMRFSFARWWPLPVVAIAAFVFGCVDSYDMRFIQIGSRKYQPASEVSFEDYAKYNHNEITLTYRRWPSRAIWGKIAYRDASSTRDSVQEGPMKDGKQHGRWTVLYYDSPDGPYDQWYWLGEKVAEKEWNRRNVL